MRTLGEIIETARDGQKPSHDECYCAMLALNALNTFDDMDFSRMYQREQDGKPCMVKIHHEERFRREKDAFATSPEKWVGWNNDPTNPEFHERRQGAKRLVDKIIKSTP